MAGPDHTLRFVWDDDARLYRTLGEKTITLLHAREAVAATGVNTTAHPYDVAAPANNHNLRIQVTFPVLTTTKAFDGFCWLANMNNEEALNYASRLTGSVVAPWRSSAS